MIPITENTILMWYLNVDDECNFSGTLEDLCDGQFEINARFRYYVVADDPDPFSGWDEKNWYRARSAPGVTKEVATEWVKSMLKSMEDHCGAKADLVEASSPEEYLSILATKPWAHFKVGTAEETGGEGEMAIKS